MFDIVWAGLKAELLNMLQMLFSIRLHIQVLNKDNLIERDFYKMIFAYNSKQ